MAIIYAIEAWILAIIAWAWITLRDLIPPRPLMEELCAYSTLTMATLNLALASVVHDKAQVFKAYLGFTLVAWTYLAYAICDGLVIWSTGSRYVPDAPTGGLCCPNSDVQAMNRQFYFGGIPLYLVSGAITFAFQTVQVFIAGGAYVTLRESVWPGNGWGYSIAALLATFYYIRFGGLVEAPCPSGAFNTLFNLSTNDGLVFAFFAFALMILVLLDGLYLTPAVAVVSRLVGLAIVTLFCASVAYVSDGRGMLTLPLLLLLLKAWIPVVWSVLEPLWLRSIPAPPAEADAGRAKKRTMRWVMPATLPSPLVMSDAPPEPEAVRAHKKRY